YNQSDPALPNQMPRESLKALAKRSEPLKASAIDAVWLGPVRKRSPLVEEASLLYTAKAGRL
ncbi:MAG: hypothetical protein M3075_13335, partial [Candidatus Dormibacteraeota bacterium]|nr:hypothetical protein [Candidatus Dormibacteraeota bacterium]